MLKAGQKVSIKVGNDTFDATVASDGELVLPDSIGDNNEVVISYETKVADYDLGDPDSSGYYSVKILQVLTASILTRRFIISL